MALPTADELLRRFEVACDLKQPVDRARIADRLAAWITGLSEQRIAVSFVEDANGVLGAALAARDAWAAMDARAARAARAARDAWAAWAARDAWDASYHPITAVGYAAAGDAKNLALWLPMLEAFEAGAFCFWFTDMELRVAVLPAVVSVDNQRRLHRADGPAFAWLGDIREHYWNGVHVPEQVIVAPDTLKVERITTESNAEVRRVMLERFGADRYLREIGARPIHADQFGKLYRAELADDEPLVMVGVVNSTPETDGHFREYFLRVQPELRPLLADGQLGEEQELTAKNAVASTFGLRGEDYAPEIET